MKIIQCNNFAWNQAQVRYWQLLGRGDGVKIPPSKVACCISRNKQLYGEYLLTCAALKNHKIGALYVHSSVYPEKKDKASEKNMLTTNNYLGCVAAGSSIILHHRRQFF